MDVPAQVITWAAAAGQVLEGMEGTSISSVLNIDHCGYCPNDTHICSPRQRISRAGYRQSFDHAPGQYGYGQHVNPNGSVVNPYASAHKPNQLFGSKHEGQVSSQAEISDIYVTWSIFTNTFILGITQSARELRGSKRRKTDTKDCMAQDASFAIPRFIGRENAQS